jgi:hypothetical protein
VSINYPYECIFTSFRCHIKYHLNAVVFHLYINKVIYIKSNGYFDILVLNFKLLRTKKLKHDEDTKIEIFEHSSL